MKKLVILVLFLSTSAYAEPVEFSGFTSIYAEYNNIRRPSRILRWRFSPVLTIYGMPLSMNLFLSSEESRSRQALNRCSIFMNPSDLKKSMVKVPSFVCSIKRVQLGTCHSNYSPFLLSGIPVTGGAIEFNPGHFYFAFTGGKTQRAVQGSDTTETAYSRMLYSGRVGFGNKNKNHVFLTLLHARDDPNSIEPYKPADTLDTTYTVEALTPVENYLIGIEAQVSLFEERLNLKSEIVGCEFTRDVRSSEIDSIPPWIEKIFHPRLSSSVDYAYSLTSSLNIYDTRIYGSIRMVGPGFHSMGTPYLRNDNLSYAGRIEKSIMDNSVSFSGSFESEHDNLIGWKTTSFTNSYALNVNLYFVNYPYVQLSYTPYCQKNKIGAIHNRMDIVSVASGYSHRFSNFNSSTNLHSFYYKYRDTDTLLSANNYSSFHLSLNEFLNFEIPLTVSSGLGLIRTAYAEETSWLTSFDMSGSYSFPNNWDTGLGLNTAREGGKNSRSGIYVTGTGPLQYIGHIRLRIETNIYRDKDKKNYSEFRITATISRRW